MRKRERRARYAARAVLVLLLLSVLTPFVYGAEDAFKYEFIFSDHNANSTFEINGVDTGELFPHKNSVILDADDRLNVTISHTPVGDGYTDASSFLIFSSSADGLTNTTYSCQNALVLPDGTYVVFRVVSETLKLKNLYLTEDTNEVSYSFSFEGEYNAVPITLEEIREGSKGTNNWQHLSKRVDTGDAYRLRIRGSGQADTPMPLRFALSETGSTWPVVLAAKDGFSAAYEINTGNGWEPFEIVSLREEGNDRDKQLLGRNFIREHSYRFKPAPDAIPTYDTLNPVTVGSVAITAAMAAAGAAIASSTASASVSGAVPKIESLGSTASSKPSIIINGGGAYPALANTKKATVELFLNVDNGLGQFYKWGAVAVAPDGLKAVVAAAVPPYGESSNAVVMISGEKLPKKKVPVFLEIIAIGLDGEELTASAELTLYEKGLFAELTDKTKPDRPESYKVTKISDGNLDGVAEINTLKPAEYTVELQEGKAVIHFGEEMTSVDI